jgi:hypothetical protein
VDTIECIKNATLEISPYYVVARRENMAFLISYGSYECQLSFGTRSDSIVFFMAEQSLFY